MPTKEELRLLQALPLDVKVMKTKQRIREFVELFGTDGVVVSFSGGKDSTVLLHLVRSLYPDVKAVFSNTGLEYPEIVKFVKIFDNVDIIRPKMTFSEIVTKYGYPLFSKEISETIYYARKIRGGGGALNDNSKTELFIREKNTTQWARDGLQPQLRDRRQQEEKKYKELCRGRHDLRGEWQRQFLDGQQDGDKSIFNKEKYLPACRELPFLIGNQCCSVMKKSPMSKYQHSTHRVPIVGTLTEESTLRTQAWLRTGCNSFDGKVMSKPLSFWTEQDILQYIKENGLPIAEIYGDIVAEDMFGCQYADTLLPCGKLRCTGASRTGCMYCAYGAGNEHKKLGKSRFELLKEKQPKVYDYIMRGGQWVDNPYYDPNAPEIDPVDGWKNWNPEKIWVPSKEGLGLKFVFDEVNKLYPDYIRY